MPVLALVLVLVPVPVPVLVLVPVPVPVPWEAGSCWEQVPAAVGTVGMPGARVQFLTYPTHVFF